MLVNPNDAFTQSMLPVIDGAAKTLNLRIQIVKASAASEIAEYFAQMARGHAGALLIENDPFLSTVHAKIAALAVQHKLPSIHSDRQYAEAGGLMSYGRASAEFFRHAAPYVDKIFKGAKPADLPVEQPTRFEFSITMKTAKALGIKFPYSIMLQATKVIE